ncbi:C3a anaphylatoxin chemotactic receptor-like [Onychostoma macrolepis]|uniref:C3a anaphylatoxin chemotactic receptor-like n=1 Tax=Onychostoma macrolepis TaxID=369639 RepID=UPI00272B61E7|nr:C3a anaphylatoxin chemotactic receptor-like [Onychostoma macrolepis]XP_058645613.1 C3a anaphylatoxin chemotactic receptor-like [Onychostoma macrolepis]
MNQTNCTSGGDFQCCFNETAINSMRVSSLVFNYLTLIVGVPGNAFVLYVAGLKMKRTVNSVGFLNLAIADLLCCLSTLYYLAQSSHFDDCPYGSIICKILHFIMLINMFASVFTLSLISLDRFTQVITPVWAQNHRSLFIARLSCAVAWILASVLSLPFMMLRETYTENKTFCLHFQHDDNFKLYRRLSIARFVFGFLVPLVCITTCYGFIARKLGRSHFHSGRAFRIMLAVMVAFFLCWLPYHIVRLIKIYREKSSCLAALAVDPLAVSLAYFNSCLNPVLYVFMGQDFKSNVKLSLRRVFERVFSEEGSQASRSTQTQHMHSV